MSRDDDDDDREPRRRRFEDDEDLELERPRKRKRSGAVTAVAIVAMVLGSQALLCGVCVGLGGVFFGSFRGILQQELAKQGAQDPQAAQVAQQMERIPTWWLFLEGSLDCVRGIGLLVGGIGALMRANWGRFVILTFAVFGVLVSLVSAGIALSLGIIDASNVASNGFGVVIQVAFTVFAFIVLMNPANIREFTQDA